MDFLTLREWFFLLVFIAVSTYGLRAFVWAVRRYVFKIDPEDNKEILQAEFQTLKKDHKDQQIKIQDLEKQNKIFVENYEATVVKLAELQTKYDVLEKENRQLKDQVDSLIKLSAPRGAKNDRILYVIIGSDDPGLSLDLASLRGVETETGLQIQQIKDLSPEAIERRLNVARREKSQVYLHMSIKADKDGYLIGERIVDATWLSAILEGVLVLVVAGTDSNYVGEFLGVVPYVITMQGSVSNREAASFTRAFWTEIGRGVGPSLALRRALGKSPEAVRDGIISHWET